MRKRKKGLKDPFKMSASKLCRSEGQTEYLPAALTPEKLVEVVPEEKTNLLRVLAHFDQCKVLQTNHQYRPLGFRNHILET